MLEPVTGALRRAGLAATLVTACTGSTAYGQATDTLDARRPIPLAAIEAATSILPVAGPRVTSSVPARITVMSGAALEAWSPRVLPDALLLLPGISRYDDLGSPYRTTLVLRGFTSSPVVGLPQGVSVFLDGMPLNEPDARQVNFDLLPLAHVQRVEVLGGTASLLGPNSLGGAINLVTQRGGPPTASLELGAGSFGARSADAAIGGSAHGWNWYAGGGWQKENGWREVTGAEQYGGFLSISRQDSLRGVRLLAYGAQSRAETAGSLPLSVYRSEPRANLTAGDFEDLSQLKLAVSGFAPAGGGLASFNVYVRAHEAERFNVNQINDPDVRSFSDNRTLGATADWRTARSVHRAAVRLRAGVSGAVSSTDVRIFGERIDPGMTTHVRSPISELGVFAVSDLARGPFTFSAGLRLDGVRIPFHNVLDPARDTVSHYLELNPRGGIAWTPGPGVTLYVSVGRSFRAPAVIELACADPENPCPLPFALGDDPPLDPVTAVTWEVGGRVARGVASLGAAAYLTQVRNDIFLFPYAEESGPVGSTIDGFFANIEATRRAGLELDANVRVGLAHSIWASYAFTRATFQVDGIELFSIREEHGGGDNQVERGDRLPLVPEHTARAGTDLRFGMLDVGVAARYTGRRWLRGDEANEEPPLAPYLLFDGRVGVARGGWGLKATVRNIFDTRHEAFGTFNLHQAAGDVLERFITPGQPRTVLVALRRSLR